MVRKITENEILERYLNSYGQAYYLRELASLLGKPHQSIKPYVANLVKKRVLSERKRKNFVDYTLNFKSSKIYDYLTIAEKQKLAKRLETDVLIQTLFDKLDGFFRKNTFIIFGSAADKTIRKSDIDLLVIGRRSISAVISDFENVYNKKLHVIQVTSLKKLMPTFIYEVYKQHLILNNTEQVVRFFGELHETAKLV